MESVYPYTLPHTNVPSLSLATARTSALRGYQTFGLNVANTWKGYSVFSPERVNNSAQSFAK